eukprot:TRINITY_DN105113_c0_g1_i1.p1 TRINITY_DN105113_c0_g1~~TRINITY_DN105113_c0_g1_i1.p1  ORF type:complete len:869 (-),score=80.20 TRINITY_DN105113_c0_g1_i1:1255-3771(-)
MGRMHGSLSRPPILFKKKERRFVRPNSILQPLNYVIVWFDLAYPHSLQSGYEFMLRDKFPTYPFRIENDFVDTVRLLNTQMANCTYVVIISGERKRDFLEAISSSPSVGSTYVIEPLITESHGLDRYNEKTILCKTFKEMTELLSKLITPIPLQQQHLPPKKMVEYGLKPDPCVMSEQAVKAIKLEKKQQDNQMRYKYTHYMWAYQTLHYFEQNREEYNKTQNAKYLENPLLEVAGPYIDNITDKDSKEFLECFINLLKISLDLDQLPFVYAPFSIKEMKTLIKGAWGTKEAVYKILYKAQKFKDALDGYKDLYAEPVKKAAEKLQTRMLTLIADLITAKTGKIDKEEWTNAPLCWSLLSDLDLCVKVFLELLLEFSAQFGSFAESLTRSLIASDYRFGIVKEIQERMIREADEKFWQSEEYDPASDALDVETAVLIVEENVAVEIGRRFRKTHIRPYFYGSILEFCADPMKRFKNNTAYFVVDPRFTQADYGLLLNACVKYAITPIVVVILPEDEEVYFSKEQLRRPWTVTQYFADTPKTAAKYMKSDDLIAAKEMAAFAEYYKDFQSTLALVGGKEKVEPAENDDELEAGWEMSEKTNPKILGNLIAELTLGQNTVGSLHFYVYSLFKDAKCPILYWDNYCKLFGASSKYINILDVCFGKNLLKAYTLQTKPPFYKLLNDAFRGGNPERISKFRAFYVMLHDLVRKNVLLQYIGTVYRGTYFNGNLLETLKVGSRFVSTCFTSTSKSEKVAYEFAAKGRKNVILELELNPKAYSNVDIHKEECSIYPEEQEVLLLPFSVFEVKRIFKDEGKFTYITLTEGIPDCESETIKSVEFYN